MDRLRSAALTYQIQSHSLHESPVSGAIRHLASRHWQRSAKRQMGHTELGDPPNRMLDLSFMYALSWEENSRHAVQPFAVIYSTCLAISASVSGGKNENVSNALQHRQTRCAISFQQ